MSHVEISSMDEIIRVLDRIANNLADIKDTLDEIAANMPTEYEDSEDE